MQRILIADDDRALAQLLADYLVREGFAVDTVHDGEAALARLRDGAQRPDLLILDVMMPGRDGLETLRELRLQQRLPVIMLSARGEPVDWVIGLELGLITFSSIFNPVFATYRLEQTPPDRVVRTLAAWSVTSKASIALLTALWGLLAAATSPRAAIAAAGALLLATPLLLPRQELA